MNVESFFSSSGLLSVVAPASPVLIVMSPRALVASVSAVVVVAVVAAALSVG